MPVIVSSNTVSRQTIDQCRTTYVTAKGTATFAGATATIAVNGAKTEARAQLALAVAQARALRCPAFGGCPNPCQYIRTARVGAGLDWKLPVKKAGQWQSTAWAYEAFDVICRCPRG
jgi:hypothetical protein